MVHLNDHGKKNMAISLLKQTYIHIHTLTYTHMHRHAQNMHTIHTYYLITHTRLVIGLSLVSDILYFLSNVPNEGKSG